MKAESKNSNSHTKREGKSQKRKSGSRPAQQVKTQRKESRAHAERAPVALGNKTYQSKPRYRNMGENLCVSHSEYIGDIIGTTSAFAVSATYNVNPGLSATFPWLNQIASRYETYKFLKLNFRFMTERPTTESGFVVIVPDYDPTDPPPASKSNAFQYESTAKCAPWSNMTQINQPRNLSKRRTYNVRQGPITAIENISLFDTANIFICVGGNSGAVNLGELWCDYEVCLETPQIDSNVSNGFDSMKLVGNTALTAALPFGSGGVVTSSKGVIASYDGVTGAITFLQPYEGIIAMRMTGTGITSITTVGSTVTSINAGGDTNTAGTGITYSHAFSATPGQILDYAVGATTVTSSVLRMGPYASSLA